MSVSGEYASVGINTIIIQDRIRKKQLTEDERLELRASIARRGLIHAPVVTRDMVLVSGENRLRECKELGWTNITIQWEDSLNPSERLAIEIEENVKRVDLDWKDRCDAVLKYHELLSEENETWSVAESADAIGWSYKTFSTYLMVGQEVESGNTRVAEAPKFSTALGITQRLKEREAHDELSSIRLSLESPSKVIVPDSPFQTADFLEWAYAYEGQPFNFIHCDFPYGIDADTFNQGAAASFGGYKDTFEHYENCINALVENAATLMGKSAHLIFWFSMKHYQYTLERLREHFWVDPYPLIWHKSDNKGTLPDPQRGPRRVYEVAFLASWGDRKIIQPVSNTFSGPTLRSGEHMSEKSEDMLVHFFRMVCDQGTRLLDPTCGSGSALRAGRRLGVGHMVGLDVSDEFIRNAKRAYDN